MVGENMNTDGYYPNLASFPLEHHKERLRRIHLSPSQRILLEDMEARFNVLKSHGITNLEHLRDILKNKQAVSEFAEASGLPEGYLTHLRRWVNGYRPKPVKLADFPPADPQAVAALASMGIKNSLHLFPRVKTLVARAELIAETGITTEAILTLTKLSDLVRLKWVGAKFAHLLLVSEFDTVEKVALADGIALYHHLQQVSAESGVYAGAFGENDINLWVKYIVCDVPISITY